MVNGKLTAARKRAKKRQFVKNLKGTGWFEKLSAELLQTST
jgi:hypothetical protein